ncbi:MAG: pkd domain containing protein, partial [Marinilabiliales bacterium]
MFNGQFKILAILTLLVFFVFFSKLYSQDCTILSKANDITPDGLCAPVSLSWEVTYTGVNNAGTLVEFQFDWDDGNAVEIVNANETSPGVFTYTISHTYPEDGPQCNYNPNVMLIVDGTICSSSLQEQNVTVWDVDDSNGGHLMIDPVQYRICVGNDGTVTFVDASLWNCVPPEETDVPNGYGRWTQWIYGTNNGAGNFIGNVEVDGVVQAYPYWGAVDFYPAVVYGPFAPNGISLPC